MYYGQQKLYVCAYAHMYFYANKDIYIHRCVPTYTSAQETKGGNFRKLLASAVEIADWTQNSAICSVTILILNQDTRSDSDRKAHHKYQLLTVKIPTPIGNLYYITV